MNFSLTGLACFPEDRAFQRSVRACLKQMEMFPTISTEISNHPEVKNEMNEIEKELASVESKIQMIKLKKDFTSMQLNHGKTK